MKAVSLLFIIVIILTTTTSIHVGGDTATAVYSECSDLKFSPSSPYQYNLRSLLSSLSNAAGYLLYSNFTTSIASPLHPVSGLYQCNGDLSVADCGSCVQSAIRQFSSVCSSSAAATVRLRGCLMVYGNESFVGKPDKSLQFKRCGRGVNAGAYDDPNVIGMRDDVLAGLLAEQGTYRVSRAGNVNGAAQCVGDQDAKHCEDCLDEAVSKLKSLCAGTVSGEVYLAKCYAEYSSAQGVHYNYNNNGHGHGNNGAGKDLAIIIGVAAAVILIILLLNYLWKSAKENGKA